MLENTDNSFDIIIIGGGLAGATLACALKNTSLKIALVEAFELNTDSQPCYDDRTVALSYGSRCIFEAIGLWPALKPYAEAIDNIHISNRGHFGVTRLSKQQEKVEALGYVLENRAIGEQLYAMMSAAQNITVMCPAQVSSITQQADQPLVDQQLVDQQLPDQDKVSVDIVFTGQSKDSADRQTLSAKLLVAADGNNSQVMQLLNIGNSRKDYQQSALITNVTPGKRHNNVAYERFTEDGPLAFLPMTENRCSVVWTVSSAQAEELLALNDDVFLQQLQQRFGFRLGQLKKAGTRQVYPLFLQSASQMVAVRVAIIGNAAHSVHPVAGQGFNLALRDIALLSELIVEASRNADDIGHALLLQRYARQRKKDVEQVYRFTDLLVKTFSNPIKPLAHMRSLSLLLVDMLPDVKHQLAKQSMGLNGRLSRLARGLGL